MRDTDTAASAALVGADDIVGGTPSDWLAIGWFTPDYRPLAERFANNLAAHGIPFHLLARPKPTAGWNTLQKPDVLLQAMDTHPGKALILMDVDCIVRGDIAPALDIAGDVGLTIKARQLRWGGKSWQRPVSVMVSSRVLVLRPTAGARSFAQTWREQCAIRGHLGDETALAWTYLFRPDVTYSHVDDRYKGWEVGGNRLAADAVIVHDSAHEKAAPSIRSALNAIQGGIKAIERRYFRSGRSKRKLGAGIG